MIYLFGDSYVDALYGDEDWRWHQRLEKDYKVCNFGCIGSGPTYSLKILADLITNKKIDDKDILIFFVPEFFRMNFAYFKNPNEQVLSYNFKGSKTYKHFVKKYKDIISTWQTRWWNYYQLYDNNDRIDVIKIYSLLNSYSASFKKVLILNIDYDFYKYESFISPVLTSHNITFPCDFVLDEVSRNEPDIEKYKIKHGIKHLGSGFITRT